MPLKSKAEFRWMKRAESRGELEPGTASRFYEETRDFESLPERVSDKYGIQKRRNARPQPKK